ncbi:MAG: hypothetical protein P8O22_12270 [Akkermansiaceae bacterium]|nr:hypothetical protein [Akkermansiaceae bacterium]|tara:strand:+ start:887 stop:1288 length:402 start_codon:yes stop_codon:yes gene_type:complete
MKNSLLVIAVFFCALSCSRESEKPVEYLVTVNKVLKEIQSSEEVHLITALERMKKDEINSLFSKDASSELALLFQKVDEILIKENNQSYYIKSNCPLIAFAEKIYPEIKFHKKEGGQLIYFSDLVKVCQKTSF